MATQSTNARSPQANGRGWENGRPNYRRHLLLGGVAFIGLVFSGLLYWTLSEQEYHVAEAEFHLIAEKKVEAIKQAIASRLGVMSLLKSFYAGSMEVEQYEFKTFSDSILTKHPDIKLLTWIPRVRAEEQEAHEAAGVKMGFPQYKITEYSSAGFVPAPQRKAYFPILYVEPLEQHRAILGFDLGSLPDCLEAMQQAQASGHPVITYSKIPDFNEEIESPVYVFEEAHTEMSKSANADNIAHNSQGFVMGAFNAREVVEKALELIEPTGADIHLIDVTDPNKPFYILSCPSPTRTTALPDMQAPPLESSATIEFRAELSVADRTWLAYCVPYDAYFSGISGWGPLGAMLAGLLITGLFVGYLMLLTERTARIEKLVTQRAKELQISEQRFRILVENAADAFYLHDQEGR